MIDHLGIFIFSLILITLAAITLGLIWWLIYSRNQSDTLQNRLRILIEEESWGERNPLPPLDFHLSNDMELAIREPKPAYLQEN